MHHSTGSVPQIVLFLQNGQQIKIIGPRCSML